MLQRNPNQQGQQREDFPEVDGDVRGEDYGEGPEQQDRAEEEEDVFLDAEDVEQFEPAPPNTDINFEEMAQNFFA